MVTNFTTTTNDVLIPEIVANEALGYLPAYLNLGKTVARDTDYTTAQVGDTVNVAKRGTVTANQKTETSSVTRQAPTATKVAVVLDQHWEVTFAEEDRVAAVQQGEVLPGYVKDGIAVLAEKIETKLAQLHPSITTTVTSTGASNVLANFATIRERHAVNKVPMLAQKYAYLHPSVITALLGTGAFNNPQFADNNKPLTEGAVLRIYGYDIFEGQLVQSTGSPVAYHNLFYHRDAMVLASRPLRQPQGNLGVESAVVGSESGLSLRVLRSFDHDTLAVLVTMDVLFGVALLDDRLIVEFESF